MKNFHVIHLGYHPPTHQLVMAYSETIQQKYFEQYLGLVQANRNFGKVNLLFSSAIFI